MFCGNFGDTVGHLARCLLHQGHLRKRLVMSQLWRSRRLWEEQYWWKRNKDKTEETCNGEMVVSSPPDSEISLWSLSSCWIWSSMLLSKFYKISIETPLPPSSWSWSSRPPAVWCWTWRGPCPPPSPPRSTPPCQGRQQSHRKGTLLKWSKFSSHKNSLNTTNIT